MYRIVVAVSVLCNLKFNPSIPTASGSDFSNEKQHAQSTTVLNPTSLIEVFTYIISTNYRTGDLCRRYQREKGLPRRKLRYKWFRSHWCQRV